jgi:hypothetical protein
MCFLGFSNWLSNYNLCRYAADKFVIAVGGRPSYLDCPGAKVGDDPSRDTVTGTRCLFAQCVSDT